MKHQIVLAEAAAATAGVTIAEVPWEKLIEPVSNVVAGVVSVLILRGVQWLARRFK